MTQVEDVEANIGFRSSEGRRKSLAARARPLVADLFGPRPKIYWMDFWITLTAAYGVAAVFLLWSRLIESDVWFYWPGRVFTGLVAAIALYRVALFMHEIVHFRRGEMTAFKATWNVLAGVPLLIPSFLYESHLTHHSTNHYGTGRDGEYLPLGGGRVRVLVGFLAQIALLPLLVFVRFLIIGPVSFLHPKLRRFVLERMSSFVINFRHRRDLPQNMPQAFWTMMEVLCFLRAAAIPIFTFTGFGGTPWTHPFEIYALSVAALGLNHIRTLVAHRYLSDGTPMNTAEQLEDSINISGGGWMTECLFPVGLRHHALHHMFPTLPYHNLGAAHGRLMKSLPEDSAYHRATAPSFGFALARLFSNSRSAARQNPTPADRWYSTRDAG